MKIGIVYDALFPYVKGGGERRYYELARRLAPRHDVHCVSWQYWPGLHRQELDGITLHGAGRPPALYDANGRRRIGEAILFALKVTPILMREKFDIIDCASVPFLPLVSSALVSSIRPTRLVAT